MTKHKKYLTEEERLAARKAYLKQYYQTNRKKMLEYAKQWREANSEYVKQWREANSEYDKQYYQANRDKKLEYDKQWYQANRDKKLEYHKQYSKTPMGRAHYLVSAYTQSDRKANRGECTLTAQWIIENIFSSKCHYCEESDWTKLGCDRINNSLPHTEDNVVPCCEECNTKRGTKSYEDFLAEIKKEYL